MVVTRNELLEIVQQVNTKFEELEKTIKDKNLQLCYRQTEDCKGF